MSNLLDEWSPKEVWRRFRLEAVAAKNYHFSYSLYIGQTHRDALLEQLLPSLLYIKAVAILDEALESWLVKNGQQLPATYHNDLNGRIEYFKDRQLLQDADQLHGIRKRRNTLAHQPGTSCNWDELEQDILSIESCLISFNLVQLTPKLDYYAERYSLEESTEPGVRFTRRFEYGVKEDGRPALEIAWTQKFLNQEKEG